MENLENIALWLSLAGVAVSIALFIVSFVSQRKGGKKSALNTAAIVTAGLAIALITLVIISRIVLTGHGPFSNMYEFALSFAWGVVLAGFIFHRRYKADSLLIMSLIIALLLLVFSRVQYVPPSELVPALQQSVLLSVHVASAVVAYGTLTIGFVSAVMYLTQKRYNTAWLPDLEVLDNITYRSVMVGFPFLTLLIVLGALWADIAWGRYWGWDPKETASLVTWLIYAAYMHTRLARGWKGRRASILIIVGFLAIVFTFFGNYIFSGLHSY
jgi:cytochrome c-type biogenesis protein CcsB